MSDHRLPDGPSAGKRDWPGYFHVPAWTQVPNQLITFWLRQLSGAELKSILYVTRWTFGYHRQTATIPFEQFRVGAFAKDGRRLDWGAGVGKTQLKLALAGLVEAGLLTRKPQLDARGGDTASAYGLHLRGEESEPGPLPTDYGVPAPYAFTPVPNQVFDQLLPHLRERQAKAILYVAYHTAGARGAAPISRRQMLTGTVEDGRILDAGAGLSERPLDAALRELIEWGVLRAEKRLAPNGGMLPSVYALNVRPDLTRPAPDPRGPLPVDSGPHVKEGFKDVHERHVARVKDSEFSPFPARPMGSRQVWAAALMELGELGPLNGSTTALKGSRLLRREGDELLVGAPTTHDAQRLQTQLADRISQVLSGIGGERVTVRFVVAR